MKLSRLSLGSAALLSALLLPGSASAQCGAPELVKGAERYNELVCKAHAASKRGDRQEALDLFLSASKQPVLESPNIRLFGQIARAYAKLGRFHEADLYLKYDNLSILWMIGIVRCQGVPNSADESLLQDEKALTSDEGKQMAAVLCGPVFDEFSYFRDRDAESFVPAATAILEYSALRKEIDVLRDRKHSNCK